MKNYTSPLLFFLLLTVFQLFAQKRENTALHLGVQNSEILSQQTNQSRVQYNNNQHIVRVTQIGNDNVIQANVAGVNSHIIDYVQNGNQNNIEILSKSTEINQSVYQNGNQNNYSHYNYNSFQAQNINILQDGNNQNIEVFGENSISKDMSIKMSGNDKTIFIRNF